MIHNHFSLSVEAGASSRLARNWLLLGVFSLLAAGLFSLLLVLSRTPVIQSLIPGVDFFHIALVVHVDLSVLIWFMSFSAVFWQLATVDRWIGLGRVGFGCAVVGTGLIISAPFIGADQPLMNNYIPVLQHGWFLTGLVVFGAGILAAALAQFLSPLSQGLSETFQAPAKLMIWLSSGVVLITLLVLAVTGLSLPASLEGAYYYEVLFWGPGHILQFSHALLMLLAWLWLAQAMGAESSIKPGVLRGAIVLAVVPLLALPWVYLQGDLAGPHVRVAFTQLMKWGGLGTLPLGLLFAVCFFSALRCPPTARHYRATLLASVTLFTAGGIIGFLIEGINVVIPAHYHGSIVGVTLAFMGLTYWLLPRLGFAEVNLKWATRQPLVYGVGQLMHILGLAWSGGYGVQRKTAGAAQGLERLPEVLGMGMMGLGGLIAIIGGVLFLLVVWGSIRRGRR